MTFLITLKGGAQVSVDADSADMHINKPTVVFKKDEQICAEFLLTEVSSLQWSGQ